MNVFKKTRQAQFKLYTKWFRMVGLRGHACRIRRAHHFYAMLRLNPDTDQCSSRLLVLSLDLFGEETKQMCFSATASFATAAATGVIGVVTIMRVEKWYEAPLAATPLIFSIQQATEGLLWLSIGGTKVLLPVTVLANVFAMFALALWPLYSPLAVGLVEGEFRRRILMVLLFAVGIVLAIYGLTGIAKSSYTACVVGNSISYSNSHPYSNLALAAYVACTCLPPLLSSHRSLWAFGLLVVSGFVVSTVFYVATQFSVWCFFAAVGSVAVYMYFAREPRQETHSVAG